MMILDGGLLFGPLCMCHSIATTQPAIDLRVVSRSGLS